MGLTSEQMDEARRCASYVSEDVFHEVHEVLTMWQQLVASYTALGEIDRLAVDACTPGGLGLGKGFWGFADIEEDIFGIEAQHVLIEGLQLFGGLQLAETAGGNMFWYMSMLECYRELPSTGLLTALQLFSVVDAPRRDANKPLSF